MLRVGLPAVLGTALYVRLALHEVVLHLGGLLRLVVGHDGLRGGQVLERLARFTRDRRYGFVLDNVLLRIVAHHFLRVFMGKYVFGMIDGPGHIGALVVLLGYPRVDIVEWFILASDTGGYGLLHDHRLHGLVLYVFL